MTQKIRAHIFISGRVQGVFFRDNTKKKARELELTGWVRNLPDGKVEIIVEGEKEKIQELIKWAKDGPPLASVRNLRVEWQDWQGEFTDFDIRYD